MKAGDYVFQEYPRVGPYEGVNAIEDSLAKSKFMVVCDEEKGFYGILLPSDLIARPHKLVIDCLSAKPVIYTEMDIKEALEMMIRGKHHYLPVFSGNAFLGIISAGKIAEVLDLYNKQLSETIIDKTSAIDALKMEARVGERLKESLLQQINHEIRTPLTGLVGFASLLVSDDITENEKADYADIIEKSSDRFLHVMDNMITLSRIQAGDLAVTTTVAGTIGEMLREVYLYFKAEITKQDKTHLSFRYDYDINDTKVYYLDFRRIKQILGYLLDNAIKYTVKGSIELGCLHADDDRLKFFVKDTGTGISPAQLKHIFDSFNLASAHNKETNSGLGLSLAIARKLAQSINGDITVESEPGKGSCFYLSIPF